MKSLAKLLLLLLVVVAGVGIFLLWSFGRGITGAVTNEIEVRQCSGVITGIDTVQSCFIKISVKEQDLITNLEVNSCCDSRFDEFFKFIEVGDSITKRKGELKLVVNKPKQHQIKKFSYPFCFQ